MPRGGPVNVGPPGWNLSVGGVFPIAGSLNGEISYGGFNENGTAVVWPLAVIVQVSFLLPKSFGTVIVKTPHSRRGTKIVGCPWSGPPGSMRLLGPTGISRVCFRFRL